MFSASFISVALILLYYSVSAAAFKAPDDRIKKKSHNNEMKAGKESTNTTLSKTENTMSTYVKRRHAAQRNKRQGPGLCPEGWRVHNDHCYLFVSQPAIWDSARRQCLGHNARLTEVSNLEENNFLGNLVMDDLMMADVVIDESGWMYTSCTSGPGQSCLVKNSECILGRCLCSPGYFYSVLTKTCIEECANSDFDGTFSTYRNYGIASYNFKSTSNGTLVECRNLCSKDPLCQSMEYEYEGEHKCNIHHINFKDVPESSREKGDARALGWALFQRNCRPDWLHTSCTVRCFVKNSECLGRQCLCSPGYFYSVTTKTCIEECASSDLDSTFSVYEMSGIHRNNITSTHGGTLGECRSLCTTDPLCLSMEYEDKGDRTCSIHHINFRNVSEKYRSIGDSHGWVMYQRNCRPATQDCYSGYGHRPGGCVWIGLTDRYRNGTFRWEICRSLPLQWTNWAANLPNNYGNDMGCVEMYITKAERKSFLWNNRPCHTARGFICKNDITGFPDEKPDSTSAQNQGITTTNATSKTQNWADQDFSLSFYNWRLNIAGVVTIIIFVIIIIIAVAVFIVFWVLRQRKMSVNKEPVNTTDAVRYLHDSSRDNAAQEEDYCGITDYVMHEYTAYKK